MATLLPPPRPGDERQLLELRRPIRPDCMTSTPSACAARSAPQTHQVHRSPSGIATGAAPVTFALIGINVIAYLAELAGGGLERDRRRRLRDPRLRAVRPGGRGRRGLPDRHRRVPARGTDPPRLQHVRPLLPRMLLEPGIGSWRFGALYAVSCSAGRSGSAPRPARAHGRRLGRRVRPDGGRVHHRQEPRHSTTSRRRSASSWSSTWCSPSASPTSASAATSAASSPAASPRSRSVRRAPRRRRARARVGSDRRPGSCRVAGSLLAAADSVPATPASARPGAGQVELPPREAGRRRDQVGVERWPSSSTPSASRGPVARTTMPRRPPRSLRPRVTRARREHAAACAAASSA